MFSTGSFAGDRRRFYVGWLVVALAVAVFVVLATYKLAAKSFWYDEAFSLTLAAQPPGQIVSTLVDREANGTVYYLVLAVWRFLGDGEGRIQFLSLLCAALTIPLLFVVGRRHVGATAAAVACLLYACNPFVIEYAQEARMYAMALLTATAAVLAWSFATSTDRTRWWIAYAVLASIAVYTHFFCGFVILGLGLTWLLGAVKRTRAGLLAQAAVVAAILPLVVFVVQSGAAQVAWILPFNDVSLGVVLGTVGAGSFALSAVLYGVAIAAIPTRDPERLRRMAPILAWWLTPIVLGLAISLVRSLIEGRYFIVALPPLLLLAGAGIVRLSGAIRRPRDQRLAIAACVIAVAVMAAGPLATLYAAPRWDWRGAADWIGRTAEPGDRITYIPDNARTALQIYLDRHGTAQPIVATTDQIRATAGRTWLVLYILRSTEYDGFEQTFPGYHVVESKFFDGVRVQLIDEP